jgi:PQQ-dependent dehydrogenase (s-GDH family)
MHRFVVGVSTLLLSATCLVLPTVSQDPAGSVQPAVPQAGSPVVPLADFTGKVLVTGLEFPWEVTWGPDDMLWVTERAGKRVTRIDPTSGEKHVAITIDEVHVGPQHEGLLGMALHPDLLKGGDNNYVYVAYTYDADPAEGDEAIDRRAKVVRLTFDESAQTLGEPKELISGIPAGDDHNAGRLKIGPDGMLYYSLGEQGANQFGNWCKAIEAQKLPTQAEVDGSDWSSYKGKVLRMDLEGGIPADNPEINGVRSHIFTYGHRNPQGLVFGPDGKLYQAEQGPDSDDEINLLTAGGNYGWPHVAGYRDDQAYVYANWSAAPDCADLTWSGTEFPESVPLQKETEWTEDFVEPLRTMHTVPNGYSMADPNCGDLAFICKPTIAPSSIDYYPKDGPIPGWGGSLLVTALKNGALYRFKLSGDGLGVRDVDQVFATVNRYRDLALNPDGKTIYIATDSGGFARDAASGATDQLANAGSILVFTYTGEASEAPAKAQ